MRRRSRAGGKPIKPRRRKAVALMKHRNAPKPVRRRSSSAGGQGTKVAWLSRERDEALGQQTATSALLSVISRSNFDLHTVLQSVIDTAARLCRAEKSVIFRLEQGVYRFAAAHGVRPAYLEIERTTPILPGPGTLVGRVAMSWQVVRIDDVLIDPLYEKKGDARIGGFRSAMGVPLMRNNEAIGVLGLGRSRVEPFSDREIELTTTFADQAVIAIENTRLLSELRESLQEKTATAEVLNIISRSTFDLAKVLNTLLELAARLSEADKGIILRPTGEDASYYTAASYRHTPEYNEHQKKLTFAPGRSGVVGRVLLEGKSVQIPDVVADPEYTLREIARLGDFRTILGVPLLRESIPIGLLVLHRTAVRPFTEKQIKLVETFADQAVIAIENVRLFEAEQQRTRELTESLEQQTATSEVLQVISSSPGDLQPVFEAILESATRICEAKFGILMLAEGDAFRLGAVHNAPQAFAEFMQRGPVRPSPHITFGRAVATKRVAQTADITIEQPYLQGDPLAVAAAELGGYRTVLAVPMLKESEIIGALVFFRQEVRPFDDKQIALVQNFASSSRHRRRERAAVRRRAGPHAGGPGIARVSDCYQRCAQRHFPVAQCAATRPRYNRSNGGTPL